MWAKHYLWIPTYVVRRVEIFGRLTKTLADKLVVFATVALTEGVISHPNISLSWNA